MRKRIYIAGPYTAPDPAINVREAMAIWHQLRNLGFSPYCPHLSHFLHMHQPRPYEQWLEFDNEWISVCDALYRFPGASDGADKEMALAISLGIPVFTNLRMLVDFFKVLT